MAIFSADQLTFCLRSDGVGEGVGEGDAKLLLRGKRLEASRLDKRTLRLTLSRREHPVLRTLIRHALEIDPTR